MHLQRLIDCHSAIATIILATFALQPVHSQDGGQQTGEAGTAFAIAREGQATCTVVVRPGASPAVSSAATSLAEQLGRITGGEYSVREGSGSQGIIVATLAQLPTIERELRIDPKTPVGRETYLLRSHPDHLLVAGATDLAVQHAVWDLLHRAGYRHFFASPAWEVVPTEPNLTVAVDALESPAYFHRRIWYGYGTDDHNREKLKRWQERNRLVSGFDLNTGHSWGEIHRRNRENFARHPEYYALVDGERTFRNATTKFCLSNADLRRLVVADRVAKIAEGGLADSVSIDPTDGGGWCECDQCQAMGSPSDRLVVLANEVAEAIVEQYGPNHYVGTYAYSAHSPPPTRQIHANVIAAVATSFIRGGYTVEELMSGWNTAGATMGIREYYAVHPWDRDLPAKGRGSRLEYLAHTIPDFHKRGARFLTAESSDNWGPNGLGYYLASRLLWDTDNAEDVDAIVDDFLTRAFGSAAEPMREFYGMLNLQSPSLPLSEHLVAKMYQRLDEATRANSDPQVQARLDSLILYTRYVELYRAYSSASGDARQQALEDLLRFGYSIRDTNMVHLEPLFRDMPRRDRNVELSDQMQWQVDDEANPLKQTPIPTRSDVQQILAAGLERNETLSFEPISFDGELVPATPLELEMPDRLPDHVPSRGTRDWYTWVDKAPATIELKVTGGLIEHYRNRGDVEIELYPALEPRGESVASGRVPPDGVTRTVTLDTAFTGLHRIRVSDGRDMTRVEWPDGMPMTRPATLEQPLDFSGRFTLYFYVPSGTTTIGGFQSGAGGSIIDPAGKSRYTFQDGSQFFAVPVPEGLAGKLWKLDRVGGNVALLTVPPYAARSSQELLLPDSVLP